MPFADLHSEAARYSNAARKRRYRATHRTALTRSGFHDRPFVGVDGEGAGVDELGRQHYQLLRAGARELWRDGRSLGTEECLGFLADLPPGNIYCGFYFDYDSTQILRDLPAERLTRLFERGTGGWHSIDWRGFEIDYLPHKHLRVRRQDGKRWTVVSDVGTFFQCSFLAALARWGVGTPEEIRIVRQGKVRRGAISRIGARERRYCALEVALLGKLMEKLRSACFEAHYLPRAWEGPGYLATNMLQAHRVPRRCDLDLPPGLLAFAGRAYYGGRFEIMWTGAVEEPIRSYDLNSAYPTALLSLPCLLHGKWIERRRVKPSGDLWVAELGFAKPTAGGQTVCDLPVRTKGGHIVWPNMANGVYWSWEVKAALEAGTEVVLWGRSWSYERTCDCRPFGFVPQVYAERQRLGKDSRGLALKLALNSLYGKLAQVVGAAPYANPIWAGLVTAHTRAAIIRAYTGREADVVMIATDGIVTRGKPLSVPLGTELGEWSVEEAPRIFLVQPGFYWIGRKVKTRGASWRAVEPMRHTFEESWRRILPRRHFEPVAVRETLFTGLRLAIARGKPETAGRWIEVDRKISFDWASKRAPTGETVGSAVRTLTQRGSPSLVSVPYPKEAPWKVEAELQRLEQEDQPDYTLRGDDQ